MFLKTPQSGFLFTQLPSMDWLCIYCCPCSREAHDGCKARPSDVPIGATMRLPIALRGGKMVNPLRNPLFKAAPMRTEQGPKSLDSLCPSPQIGRSASLMPAVPKPTSENSAACAQVKSAKASMANMARPGKLDLIRPGSQWEITGRHFEWLAELLAWSNRSPKSYTFPAFVSEPNHNIIS